MYVVRKLELEAVPGLEPRHPNKNCKYAKLCLNDYAKQPALANVSEIVIREIMLVSGRGGPSEISVFFLFGVSVMALFQAIRNSEGKFSNFYTKSKLFQEHNLIKILELYILLSIHLLYFSIKKVSYSFLDKIVKEAVSGGNRWLLKIRDLLHLVIRSPKLMLLIKGLTNDP